MSIFKEYKTPEGRRSQETHAFTNKKHKMRTNQFLRNLLGQDIWLKLKAFPAFPACTPIPLDLLMHRCSRLLR